MGEEHAGGDFRATGIGGRAKFRDRTYYRSVKFEQATFVEDCCHGGCGYRFRERRDVKERGGGEDVTSRIVKRPTSRKGGEKRGTLGALDIPGIIFIYEGADRFQGS